MHHSYGSGHPIRMVILSFMALITVVLFTNVAYAIDPINKTWFRGLAIHGYDPVAYFTEEKAVEGSDEFEYEWRDATWRFSSAENRDKFISMPERFAPQYGGYCAYALAQGLTVDIDPEAWTIVDDKLYLNVNKSIQRTWQQDLHRYIAQADANWPRVLIAEE